jgi:hypothetical protein
MEASVQQVDRGVEEGRKTKLLERMREDLRAGRPHPRGVVSAELIRTWGFARVMKHMARLRRIFERVEAEEREHLERRRRIASERGRAWMPVHPGLMEKDVRGHSFRRRGARQAR